MVQLHEYIGLEEGAEKRDENNIGPIQLFTEEF